MPTQPQKPIGKAVRRAEALKREKQKKQRTIMLCTLIVASIIAFIAFSQIQQSKKVIFTDGYQSVTFHEDGSFKARLAHETKRGTYVRQADGSVLFTVDGVTVNGVITNDLLTFPEEWNDGHGHGTTLQLQ